MHPLERVPAIRRIETDRADVFAMEIAGKVTSADVENLYGLLEGAYALHDRLDLLVRLADFEGIQWDGVSDETAHSVEDHALRHVRRLAAVGTKSEMNEIEAILRTGGQVERKRFEPEEEPDAWTWIGAREIG